ncbi:asparaginase [Mesobaculum littorinae]|uniref:Asparaginase n=1 Tax=Mesobaculum littorinae TaxID=2486419 RepID=A0A438AI28_9RHOB|nr:asparaginase [Mesobaculum littorinae]RVV98369.1 asparaginase [Mesobaculum littorinae]
MTASAPLVEVWRGNLLESLHRGHAVICDSHGIVEAWGDPQAVIYPRSSCKMMQALPLVESGAADGLSTERLALACASHQGAPVHTGMVSAWLAEMGMSDDDLLCGTEVARDAATRDAMIVEGAAPCQAHNNCSGKHAGFLALTRHLRAGADYVDPAHPVQTAVRAAFEDLTQQDSPGYGIDGCSAPNFATTVEGLARAMAAFAAPGGGVRGAAMTRLEQAMRAHPVLVAGEERACTELMQAMDGNVAIKTGAEGVFVAIWPERGLGLALKIEDGATRASECAVAALLSRMGALDPAHPAALRRREPPILNRAGLEVGRIQPAPALA